MDDLISRQMAIASAISGKVRTLPTSEDGEDWIRTSEVRESLLNLPSVQKRGEWIPCSEQLPEKHDEYLVTVNDYIMSAWYGKPLMPDVKVGGKCWYVPDREVGDVVYDDVIAWMPLPEPYKKEGDV